MSASTRDAVLKRIRRAVGATPAHDRARREAVAERLSRTPAGIVPERGQVPPAERLALFVDKATVAAATVTRVENDAAIPDAIATYLREHNLPAAIKTGHDPRLTALDFSATALRVSRGPSDGDDLTSLSRADGGIAETGTLVLTSGRDNPTSLNFLPEYHIVILDAADVAGDMEAVIAKLRQRHGQGELPRSVNFITGPSRSADIEQTMLLGAHGPRSLHIIVIGEPGLGAAKPKPH
ncbi:lactate utilization protein [Jiella sp. MQZ9-1]|uniref:Lactate utilization protein n=1 Tax=Jiella flava TaxID=2816857 RepID=A0A939JY08_9HYPH|nr:lactate utilization protein [Jiella flava]MBO0663921.1 lactate utilization protein [Jiella flava]MCD2472493.1 lactate utilization protein [Jiella flava]